MKSFITKTVLFAIPIIVIFSPVHILLWLTGENYSSIDKVVVSDDKYLIGYAYNQSNYRYLKWKTIIEEDKKEIWALGSSRVLQFRKEMFKSPFYNSGFTISSIADFLPYLQSFPNEKYPDVLIIALDQWMFNQNWDDIKVINDKTFWENSFISTPSSGTIISVIKDLIEGKYGPSLILKQSDDENNHYKIGLNALVNDKGFRNDGSIYYGNQIEMLLAGDSSSRDFNYSDTYNRIENGNRRFQYGNAINPEALVKLEQFLKFCFDNEIFVVGFLPPFATKVNEKIEETGKYNYMSHIYNGTVKYFERYNYELWDFTNLKYFDSGDDETIDGFHGGELTYLKMLIYMINNNSNLRHYANVSQLRNDASNRINRYLVYDY